MANFTVSFAAATTAGGAHVEIICDAYRQEGPMFTFFDFGADRDSIDAWSRRVASFRAADVVSIVEARPQGRTDQSPSWGNANHSLDEWSCDQADRVVPVLVAC